MKRGNIFCNKYYLLLLRITINQYSYIMIRVFFLGTIIYSFFFNGTLAEDNDSIQYWQQEVNFKIEVKLNDTHHELDGYIIIEYINNSPDTLNHLYFHLWPNAYKNAHTAFARQQLENTMRSI